MKFLFGIIFLTISFGFHSKASSDQEAKDFIAIYSKYDGSPGYPIYNWYGSNKSTNRAIRITVAFRDSNTNNQWNKSFDLEPGEIKALEVQTYGGSSGNTSAQLVGARFL